jgi:Calx-beta domain/Bacterial pre-peptidase C-terminal domain
VVIPIGQSSVTIPIAVLDDLIVEGNETVILSLSANAAYTLGTTTQATVTIADNDQAPTLPTVSITTSTNGAEPNTHGSFIITRTGSSSQAVTMRYAVTGTATNGTDYQTLGQSVVIPADQTSITIPVTVLDDLLVEGDETVILTLALDPGYTLGTTTTQTVTITDNDVADGAGNTLPTARDIGTLTTTQQSFTDRVDNGDKKDYYRVVMATRGTLRATITGNTADIDIELLDSAGTLIDFSDHSGVKDESINRIVPAGTYYLFVYPYGSAQSGYTLKVWRA